MITDTKQNEQAKLDLINGYLKTNLILYEWRLRREYKRLLIKRNACLKAEEKLLKKQNKIFRWYNLNKKQKKKYSNLFVGIICQMVHYGDKADRYKWRIRDLKKQKELVKYINSNQ